MPPVETGTEGAPAGRWSKPVIEDFGVSAVTAHFFSVGIDNYEGDNPVNYGNVGPS